MDPDFTGLLLLIGRQCQSGHLLKAAALRSFAGIKLPSVTARFRELLDQLFEAGLAEGNLDLFTLTAAGLEAVAQAEQQHSLTEFFYDAYYDSVRNSPAHSRFCARVYGLDLCQHGMADMEQLNLALERLQLTAGKRLFEFGCGDGRIAEYIASTRAVRVTGLDIAPGAIALARERIPSPSGPDMQLEFLCIDIFKEPRLLPSGPYDAALAVDSLFFVADQRAALKRILALLKPGGRFAVFYISPARSALDETALGMALNDLGLRYETIDLTAANLRHWELKKAALEELRPVFLAEGSDFLLKNRLAECQGWEHVRRTLFVIIA